MIFTLSGLVFWRKNDITLKENKVKDGRKGSRTRDFQIFLVQIMKRCINEAWHVPWWCVPISKRLWRYFLSNLRIRKVFKKSKALVVVTFTQLKYVSLLLVFFRFFVSATGHVSLAFVLRSMSNQQKVRSIERKC